VTACNADRRTAPKLIAGFPVGVLLRATSHDSRGHFVSARLWTSMASPRTSNLCASGALRRPEVIVSADFNETMARSRAALDQIAKGNPEGYKSLYSRRPDITLGNPFGGFGRGEAAVFEQLERAASHYRDGETVEFETVSQLVEGDLAYTVEVERLRAKVGGLSDLSDLALRVTCVYWRENGEWKLVHRHADPRVDRQAAESVIQK
jgi:ketosteroid isomerase-like protein